jgi:carboxylesterase
VTTALEIAAAVRAGERTARSVVDEHLATIDAREGELHAFNLVLADEARADADAIDAADPSQKELAYDGLPVAALLSLVEAQAELAPNLGEVRCPTLLFTSRQDHVVPPSNSDYLAEHVGGPVERVFLERSFHVATIDYDRDEIAARSVEFARKVTAG